MASDIEYYALENDISKFFQTYTSATREQCDQYAASVAGEPVTPEPIQGMWSYTVTAGPRWSIVQFRAPSSLLDMELLLLARDTHGPIVPECVYQGAIGHPMPLPVYLMEKLPGVPYCLEKLRGLSPSSPMSPAATSRVMNTVADFARLLLFFHDAALYGAKTDGQILRLLLAESAGNGNMCYWRPPH